MNEVIPAPPAPDIAGAPTPAVATPAPDAAVARVVGLGRGGVAMVEMLLQRGLPAATALVAASDAEAIAASSATGKVLLPAGRAAQTATDALPEDLSTAWRAAGGGGGCLFLVAGLGGATGSRWTPRAARAAREAGAMVFALVTLPFEFEGSARKARALAALQALREVADGVLALPCETTKSLAGGDTALDDAYATPAALLADAAMGLWRLVLCPARLRLHPEDLCAALRGNPVGWTFATAAAEGPRRAADAAEALLAHPLMEGGESLRRAGEVILSVSANRRLPAADLQRLSDRILQHVGAAAVTTTVSVDDSLGERLSVLVLAGAPRPEREVVDDAPEAAVAPVAVEAALLPPREVVPPGRAITLAALPDAPAPGPAPVARRKPDAPPRQAQLPLDMPAENRAQKNPFQSAEATMHKGQNLDLPAYLRHSTPLN